ncbi:SPOR domain-containing protein [Inhella gelatinilytica]|uniref:SPOR domain-containing protein n=1 Tax=Inhella gelatinilytica TaxID=2795030 RepID=A0A931J0C9_9BURK|nr:SPOR domain-containing protein [Inhella gelatinilytica]MBH9553081.1 SPOR domain-containing protein [Inhella gelatinilytica]
MDWLSLFRRRSTPEPSGRGKRARAAAHDQQLQQLRQRARHRLIGAAVLVGLGLIAFPLVFETQPRPVPMDLPIVIPSKDTAPALVVPSPVASANLPEAAVRVAATEPDDTPTPQDPLATTPASAPVPKGGASSVLAPVPDAAPASVPAKALPPNPAASSTARYIVQVGAYADKNAAQEVRRKLEAKGLKTYAQVVKTPEGERVRVRLGPFADKAEAEKTATKAKGLGLGASVLTL